MNEAGSHLTEQMTNLKGEMDEKIKSKLDEQMQKLMEEAAVKDLERRMHR